MDLSATDKTGALHIRRKVLYKVDVERALELGLDANTLDESDSPPKAVQEGVSLLKEINETQILKVLLPDRILVERVIKPPVVSEQRRPLRQIPTQQSSDDLENNEEDTPHYIHGTMQGVDEEIEDVSEMVGASQTMNTRIRGEVM